jgi:hypothetical protein
MERSNFVLVGTWPFSEAALACTAENMAQGVDLLEAVVQGVNGERCIVGSVCSALPAIGETIDRFQPLNKQKNK